jgi:hypothetical protein
MHLYGLWCPPQARMATRTTVGPAEYSEPMEIARERFLDQSRDYYLTLALRSRTTSMHSALTALTAEERAAVAASLSRALDEIAAVVARHLPKHAS